MRGQNASAEGEFVLISANWPLRCGIRSVLAPAFPGTRIHEIDGLGAIPKPWPGAAPTLVFLDSDVPTLAPATLRLLRTRLGAPVVVLVDEHSDAAVMSLRSGAQGCIPRDFHGDSLIAAVRLILSGPRFFPATLLDDLLTTSGPLRSAPPNPAFATLTRQQTAVLTLLIEGLSNKDIARHLGLEQITVKIHLRAVYRKLHASNRAQAVGIALRGGWPPTPPVPCRAGG